MRYETWIGWRYLTKRGGRRSLPLVSLISILGVAIGVMALIVVLAVMTGFDEELKNKIVGTNAHLTIEGRGLIGVPEELMERLSRIEEVKASSPYLTTQAILSYENRAYGVILRGIDAIGEAKVTRIGQYLTSGKLNLNKRELLLGKELALTLGVNLGEEIILYSPGTKGSSKFKVAGIFCSGMYDYDKNLAFINLKDFQEIFGLPNVVGGIGVRLSDPYLASKVREEIKKELGDFFKVTSWMDRNRSLFSALKLEKITMFIILSLIVLVACFSIISTLTMMVAEKTKDIGILRALGARRANIRRIFISQGLLIGILGISLGSFGGIFLCWLLKRYQFIRLPQEIYYFQRLPIALNWEDAFIIALVTLAICLVSSIYPSFKAANLSPVEALRYE